MEWYKLKERKRVILQTNLQNMQNMHKASVYPHLSTKLVDADMM